MKESIDRNIQADLSDRVSVVIGGTGSIGEEIALSLLRAHSEVIITGHSEDSISERMRKYLESEVRLSFHLLELPDEESVNEFSRKIITKWGRVDILVIASGVQLRKPFYQYSLDEWNKVIGVNLTGTFLVCKYFSKYMMDRNYGRIIGITSLTSKIGLIHISAYASSKGGMSQFLKTLSVELAPYNIAVNMIAPGRIQTVMTQDLLSDANTREANINCIPMGRLGVPSDITGAVLYLASDSSRYITGQTIVIDGGWLASGGNTTG
ncbi:MAG: SDR family oxidoreductase [Deltaproteobacteria bacterium]|nr:SDR family oxidoreductase [Deltaproteobacteria bacterium]